jgi:citrate synthase
MGEIAKLELNGVIYEFPVIEGTENEKAIDISALRGKTGYITIDPGFKNTGSTTSAITYLDGEQGILKYRGYPIEQLAEKASFIEVAYLLIYGNLPSKTELAAFTNSITKHTLVHEDMKQFFEAYPAKAHPMGVLASMVSSLSTFYPESLDSDRTQDAKDLTIHRLLAKLPTLAAWSYKNAMRHPFMYPKNDLDYCANFMHMMFAMPTEEYTVDPVIVSALNKLLILHADHEQNCSTATVRVVGSSKTNLYSSVSAGISALWGPLHGGANQAVLEMLEKIQNDGGDVDKWVLKAKDKDDSFRLMGFGHRVYKNFDPRAKIIKKLVMTF